MLPCLVIGLFTALILSPVIDNGTANSPNGMVIIDSRIRILDWLQDRYPDRARQEQVVDVSVDTLTDMATPPSNVENVVLRPPQNLSLLLRSGNNESFDRLLSTIFGVYSLKAFSIADCEQGWKLSAGLDPYVLNRTAVGAAGEVSLWQIHPVHFWKYDKARLQADVEYAAQAAWELSGYGSNWTSPWRICG